MSAKPAKRERAPGSSPGRVLRRIVSGVLTDQCPGSAAMIAYYLLFATFPFLIALTSLTAFLPMSGLMERLLKVMAVVAPPAAVELVRGNLAELASHQQKSLLWFSLALALWAASNAVEAVMQGMNRVHRVSETRAFWKVRGLAILLAVGVSALTVLGLMTLWFGSQVSHWWENRGGLGPLPVQVWDVARWPLVLLFLNLAVAHVFYFAPNLKLRFRLVTPGSAFAVLGWVLASQGFSAYVRHFGSYNATYGSLGAVIILLTWMYLTAYFILVGAVIDASLHDIAREQAELLPEPEPEAR